MSSEPPALAVEQLGLIRGGRRLLRDLSLDLPAGGALILRGANGAGKSSLLRALAGLLPPVEGRIDRAAGGLAYLGHLDAVKPRETPREALEFWAELRGPGPLDAAGALAALDLGTIADRPGRYLSFGQRRRVALARLLVDPARLWLLDEPAAGLDQAALARLTAMIATHRAGGGAAVIAAHDPLELPGAVELVIGAEARP